MDVSKMSSVVGLLVAFAPALNVIVLLLVPLIVARINKLHRSLVEMKDDVVQVKDNVQKIETATNSMKDALVAATAKASLAEGTAIGRAEIVRENKPEMG